MSTALYRRYRPQAFQEVIGQEHVTEPLMAALRADRANHAYLFSGPRGCGKTTSARILARCLNCVEGPTDTPCGTCPSCVELARGGAGSLDVVEIDAASHNGVDDARELRERATYAPARDRYKIFILDEAHMVTAQGFNALLKLVEEPPDHVKFVFATTEPEKVIGTIRSRTHHYPFRLVPPEQLLGYLEQLSQAEGVEVATGVLPMVVRAGGGSVRDTLSVLDQLLAGAEGRLEYPRALALLGYTDATLLDDGLDALAARDGATLFRVVDRLMESGHDPRRFVEDLLERLRDLVLIAVSDGHAAALRGLPQDQLERMRTQSRNLGLTRLSRAADLVNDALSEMSGATSPRLQLELLCARLVLPAEPAADAGAGGDGVAGAGGPAAGGPARPADPPAVAPSASLSTAGSGRPAKPLRIPTSDEQAHPAPAASVPPPPRPEGGHVSPAPDSEAAQAGTDQPAEAPAPPVRSAPAAERTAPATSAAQTPQPVTPAPRDRDAAASTSAAEESDEPAEQVEMIRRRWSEVTETLRGLRVVTWALVGQHAQVGTVSGTTLHLLFPGAGMVETFRSGNHAQHVERALNETLGVRLSVEAVADGGGPEGGPGGGEATAAPRPDATAPAEAGRPDRGRPAAPADTAAQDQVPTGDERPSTQPSPEPAPQPASESAPPAVEEDDGGWPTVALPPDRASSATPATPAGRHGPSSVSPASGAGGAGAPPQPEAESAEPAAAEAWPSVTAAGMAPAEEAVVGPEPASEPEPEEEPPADGFGEPPPDAERPTLRLVPPMDDDPSEDDPDVEGSSMVGVPLVERILGGRIIEEIPLQGDRS
ncbi:DNA polymerase III subunit gamma and tau [Bogoriella caseilytica]|uniref:DNA polymerase III subunit gamma and tau n=1 Tax=Bogoriella caseilytica TaxID=56055 RepID=UPI000F4716F0|nr:DNA polymerase III subunit gamma and tau [Bogoriella caseilytica]